jgi:uncharacterized protein (DUF1697 family)
MPIYISLLRGINVSGQKQVRMDQLRDLFASLNFKNVKTYIQSGNVVFDGKKSDPLALSSKIKAKILDELGFSVPVFTISASDMKKVVLMNPFLKKKGIEISKLHVTFLLDSPTNEGLGKLSMIQAGQDEFKAIESFIYLSCPNGYGTSKLTNTAIERLLRVEATTRNWKTVNELSKLSSE